MQFITHSHSLYLFIHLLHPQQIYQLNPSSILISILTGSTYKMVIVKNLSTFLPLVLAQVLSSNAHLSVWMPSMFGLDPGNINSDNASQPLQDYTFGQW